MILNEAIMHDDTKMTNITKREIVSVFCHLCTEDQNYLLDHLKDFVPQGTVFMIPMINNIYPQALIKFVNYIYLNYAGYFIVKFYDASIEFVAAATNSLSVGSEISVLYRLFGNEKERCYQICRVVSNHKFDHPSDLYNILTYISKSMDNCGIDPYRYPECVLSLCKIYDIIMRVSIDNKGIENIMPMETQALAFVTMSKSLKNYMDMKHIKATASLEINLLTSLVKPSNLFADKYTLRTFLMVLKSPNSEVFRVETFEFIRNRLNELSDPFRISLDERFPKGIRFNLPLSKVKPNIDRVISHLIENTTRKKIKDLVEKYTGLVEELDNITFDIPEDLLSMYQYEFGKDYPIILSPITDNMDKDGSDWRHVIYYENNTFIAFTMKDSPDKLYGICITDDAGEDTNCNIVEFTGKKGASYSFIY